MAEGRVDEFVRRRPTPRVPDGLPRSQHEAELKWRDDTVAELKSERNWAVKKIKALEKELEQLQAEKAAGALTELVEPRTVSAFALQAEARREEARALEEQLEAERHHSPACATSPSNTRISPGARGTATSSPNSSSRTSRRVPDCRARIAEQGFCLFPRGATRPGS